MILVGCNAPQLSLHRGSFLQPGLSLRAGVGKLVSLKKDVREATTAHRADATGPSQSVTDYRHQTSEHRRVLSLSQTSPDQSPKYRYSYLVPPTGCISGEAVPYLGPRRVPHPPGYSACRLVFTDISPETLTVSRDLISFQIPVKHTNTHTRLASSHGRKKYRQTSGCDSRSRSR